MSHGHRNMTRRQFLRQSSRSAGLIAAGGVSLAATARLAEARDPRGEANPFAYDVGRVSRTDPKLIRYETAVRFPCPNAEPRRLAIGPDGRLYIATKNGIAVLDRTGARSEDIAVPAPARCVAVGEDGTVYIGLRNHIEVYDRQGQRRSSWDSPGGKAWFSGLAVAGDHVFAADAGNRVVLKYDKSGKVAARIGEKSKDRNIPGLIVPSPYLDVESGTDGLLRVNNPGRHCVDVYTANGDLEFSWGKPSAAIEGFCGCCNPVAIALLPDGRCVTCEKGLPRVKVYSAQGEFECVVAGPESFPENAKTGAADDKSDGIVGGLDAAVDGQGRIFVLDLVAAEVRLMQPKA